ncbi:uncharacterized protein LOC128138161, partial [Harpia harpyja]|uniref:uncharacterized protein LOC128138161 n=1 Tax=Harpia harpyja TaxID=202280 RepID=UPI0022B0CE3C
NSILFQSAAEPARSSTLCRLHRCGWDRAVLHIPKATKSHPCPCCFAGSFCDASDVLGADLLDCSYSMPDRQLVRRVASQVEFHLSDENLAKDAFLLKHVQRNKVGFVSIKLLTSLKKVGSPLRWPAGVGVSSTGFSVSWVPIPESLLSIHPSKLLLAWELLLLEQDMLLLLQKNFLKTITRMFSPFGTIASIRILRPGRKLPSGVRKYTSDFPELLSKHCALVEYKSLGSASALRSLEDLGRQSGPCGESIRVVRLCGKGSKKTPGAEREVAEELVDQPGWKAQAVAATFPDGLGDSLLCSSPELNGAQALPPLLLHKDPSAPSRPGSNFKPSNFGNGFNGLLLASKVFPPLGTGLGTGSCYGLCSSTESTRGCGWGSGVGAWAPWPSSPSPDAKPLAGNPPAATWVPEPLGCGNCLLRDQPKPPPSYLSESSDLCFWYRRSQLPASGSSNWSELHSLPGLAFHLRSLRHLRGGDGLTDSGGAGVSPPLQALGDGIASPSAAPSFPRQKKRTDTRPWGLPPLNRSALPQVAARSPLATRSIKVRSHQCRQHGTGATSPGKWDILLLTEPVLKKTNSRIASLIYGFFSVWSPLYPFPGPHRCSSHCTAPQQKGPNPGALSLYHEHRLILPDTLPCQTATRRYCCSNHQ